MSYAWNSVFQAACKNGMRTKDARRLANLIVADAITTPADGDSAGAIRRISRLMMTPAFPISLEPGAWQALIELAANAVKSEFRGRIDYDGWVQEFQRSDPSRKNLGAYATPTSFAEALAVAAIPDPSIGDDVNIIDPSCGAGALLIACLDRLHPEKGRRRRASALRLHGMEIDPAARELACLHVWMAAGAYAGDLKKVARNITCGNALMHAWRETAAYDVVVMNPPWDSLRHKASDAAQNSERTATIRRMDEQIAGAEGLPSLFSSQGTGDRNLCKAFIELAPHLLASDGRIAALIPAAFASDEGMRELRVMYLDHFALESWTGFENRGKAFDIDSRYKFGILTGARSQGGTQTLRLRAFAVEPSEISAPHVAVGREQLAAIGGPVGIIPDVTSKEELNILTTMLRCGTAFFADGDLGTVGYRREVDLTMGKAKGLFSRIETRPHSWNGDGTMKVGTSGTFVPVLEGRMVGQYDYFQKSWVEGQGRTAVWRSNGEDPLSSCRPQYITRPTDDAHYRLAICDVTSATNTRTVHATIVPDGWLCGNTAPVLRFVSEEAMYAGLAILNSLTFDWLARRMVSGLHLNKFYLSCMTWPDIGSDKMRTLSSAGRALAMLGARRPLGRPGVSASRIPDLQSAIEAIVASGYGIDGGSLSFMFANDPNDRRGFWRYYSSVPNGADVAGRSVELLNAA
ncbi:N-6 DNA methylase [Acidiphilium acidophilum]|uniref:N-6 DNA methylase n=1 Tax=Acidiphilium acidophilum TaxID=76588 RepID=UPI002E8E6D02|nr:N-6 DNA methylase [Acidiphilium acidophilum]